MNTRRVSVWSAAVVALLVAASLTRGARAADAAGIYKGSYASYSAGGDYGTVTRDEHNGVLTGRPMVEVLIDGQAELHDIGFYVQQVSVEHSLRVVA